MLHSASRQARDELRTQTSAAYRGAEAEALVATAGELYAIAAVLVGQPRLRRILGDPATEPDRRAGLLTGLLGDQVGDAARDLGVAAVRLRWSSPWDLTDAIEAAGDDALFAAAEKSGDLDRVEDELFRFERIIQVDGDVVGLLDETTVTAQRRSELLDSLVAGKVAPTTLALLHHAIASDRKRSILLALDDLLERAASRQELSIARVISAVPLSDAQEERLAAALGEIYGRPITLRVALDERVRGGLIIRVGDEVIDGSIASRLARARAGLVG